MHVFHRIFGGLEQRQDAVVGNDRLEDRQKRYMKILKREEHRTKSSGQRCDCSSCFPGTSPPSTRTVSFCVSVTPLLLNVTHHSQAFEQTSCPDLISSCVVRAQDRQIIHALRLDYVLRGRFGRDVLSVCFTEGGVDFGFRQQMFVFVIPLSTVQNVDVSH